MRRWLLPILSALIVALAALPAAGRSPVIQCVVLAEMPHDPATSTQGFFIRDGVFYESSGGYNKSFLIKSEPVTGRVLVTHPIDTTYFAEGIAPFREGLRLITWQSGTGFVHDRRTLRPTDHFSYRGKGLYNEGWGLTEDGRFFILSSGTSILRFHSPESFTLVRTLEVLDDNRPISMLNELEYVEGFIYANVWKSDIIRIIDPRTGAVPLTLDISALRHRLTPDAGVANGIAYDAEKRRLYVTGKHWDKVFEIAVPSLPGQP